MVVCKKMYSCTTFGQVDPKRAASHPFAFQPFLNNSSSKIAKNRRVGGGLQKTASRGFFGFYKTGLLN